MLFQRVLDQVYLMSNSKRNQNNKNNKENSLLVHDHLESFTKWSQVTRTKKSIACAGSQDMVSLSEGQAGRCKWYIM